MTLVELLVTISIIGILMSAMLLAMAAASESASEAKTRTTIAKLNALLIEQWESYRIRRAPVSPPSGANRRQVLQLRLEALRELVKMEMPDRWSDIVLGDVASSPPGSANADRRSYRNTETGVDIPSLSRAYWRRYNELPPARPTESSSDYAHRIRDNQGAECLYMIISIATGDGEALAQFSESEIGDVDEDGAPEFLDGWGNPIRFLRWAPGFSVASELQSGDPDEQHDPFDPYRIEDWAFALIPLIYSPGPDESPDILAQNTHSQGINPYESPSINSLPDYLGTPMDTDGDGSDQGWLDNIHNHLIGLR